VAAEGPFPPVDELNALGEADFATSVTPLFEGAPRFVARLAAARPFESDEQMLAEARRIAREMPEDEQLELINAHPRIGGEPSTMSTLSRAEQGYGEASDDDYDPDAWVADELAALNDAYESRFGFRYVVFVAGRPRREVIPIMESTLRSAERDEEIRRAVDDIVLIAGDRLRTLRGEASEPSEASTEETE
jgi:2-oxo-4-hydroxy-4-carboxy--5-ureidoimidazoline (OHCU) decarboxylase